MMMTSFPKADPENLPGGMVMMTKEVEPGEEPRKKISIGGAGGADGTVMVMSGGLVIGPGPGGLGVLAVLPDAAEHLTGELPTVGDRLVSVNNQAVTDVKALQAFYESIPEGDTVKATLLHGEDQHEVSFVKAPMTGGNMMIKKR
jgi:S1-C subfamily serine protease